MADYNYIFTNTIGAIKITGSGKFNSSNDPSGIGIRNIQDNFDMKACLVNEVAYKYINKKAILIDEEGVSKLNSEIIFGAYSGVQFSKGRKNDINLAYRFTTSDKFVTYNPGLLISNTYLLNNIDPNNEDGDIKNNEWIDAAINININFSDRIRIPSKSISFGDINIFGRIDLPTLYNLKYKKYALNVIDKLLKNNFKKRVVVNFDTETNERIIQLVLLLLPLEIAKIISFNTNVKDKKGYTGCILCGLAEGTDIKGFDDFIRINSSCNDRYETFFVKSLNKESSPLNIDYSKYNLNESLLHRKEYFACLDGLFVNPNNLDIGIEFFNYYANITSIDLQLENETIEQICKNSLVDIGYVKKYNNVLLAKYICKKQNNDTSKLFAIDFIKIIFEQIFYTNSKDEIVFYNSLFANIIADKNINIDLISSLTKDEEYNISLLNGIDEFLANDNFSSAKYIEDFLTNLLVLFNRLTGEYSLDENLKLRFVEIFNIVFTSYLNRTMKNVIVNVFNAFSNVDDKYRLLKYLILTELEINLENKNISNEEALIMNFIGEIVRNEDNILRNKALYDELIVHQTIIDRGGHSSLYWMHDYIIAELISLEEVFELNRSINDNTEAPVVHQIHKKTTKFLNRNITCITYENVYEISALYNNFENDEISDFHEIEEVVMQKIQELQSNKLLIETQTSTIKTLFENTYDEFVKRKEELGQTCEGSLNVTSINAAVITGGDKDKKYTNSLILTVGLLVVTFGLCIPSIFIAKVMFKFLLIFMIVSLATSIHTHLKFKKHISKNILLHIFVNNLLSTILPLVLINGILLLLYYLL